MVILLLELFHSALRSLHAAFNLLQLGRQNVLYVLLQLVQLWLQVCNSSPSQAPHHLHLFLLHTTSMFAQMLTLSDRRIICEAVA